MATGTSLSMTLGLPGCGICLHRGEDSRWNTGASLPPSSACVPPALPSGFLYRGAAHVVHPISSSPLPLGRIGEDWDEPAPKALGKQQGQGVVAEQCQGVRRRAGSEQRPPLL